MLQIAAATELNLLAMYQTAFHCLSSAVLFLVKIMHNN
jgi:hypothetical protein